MLITLKVHWVKINFIKISNLTFMHYIALEAKNCLTQRCPTFFSIGQKFWSKTHGGLKMHSKNEGGQKKVHFYELLRHVLQENMCT